MPKKSSKAPFLHQPFDQPIAFSERHYRPDTCQDVERET